MGQKHNHPDKEKEMEQTREMEQGQEMEQTKEMELGQEMGQIKMVVILIRTLLTMVTIWCMTKITHGHPSPHVLKPANKLNNASTGVIKHQLDSVSSRQKSLTMSRRTALPLDLEIVMEQT